MRVGVTRRGFRVVDSGDVLCHIAADDWESAENLPGLERSVDASISGRASRLCFPPGQVSVATPRCDGGGVIANGRARHVGPDRTLVRIDSAVTIFLAIQGDAIVHNTTCGIQVPFESSSDVTLGLRDSPETHSRTITVPGTPTGVAAALTQLSSYQQPTSPFRSDPTRRQYIPSIELGDTLQVPAEFSTQDSDNPIDLFVPPRLDFLFVLAPLAHYLGARVRVEDRSSPKLSIPGMNSGLDLPGFPHIQARAASLLYRTVLLDSLLVMATKYPPTDESIELLETIDLDPDQLRSKGIPARFVAYLESPFERIEAALPNWHLSMYVQPRPKNVVALPQVLDRLAFVYLPEACSLDLEDRLQRSLEDFYRTTSNAPTVDPILPDLHRGRIHGWVADGVPIDAFTYLPSAYEHRLETPSVGLDTPTLTVVVNDDDMANEATRLKRLYTESESTPVVDFQLKRNLDRKSLATALERPTTVFHYIGHCDEAGLRCEDGHLPLSRLEHSGVRTFFLNACGSYHEGRALIRNGSIAGAVTLRPILNEQATRVGSTFTHLLLAGFAVERALRIACRRSIMNKDYVVVGDGSYSITSIESGGEIVYLSEDGNQYHLEVENGLAATIEGALHSTLGQNSHHSSQVGTDSLSKEEVISYLDRPSIPVIFRNRFFWGTDLAERLRSDTFVL